MQRAVHRRPKLGEEKDKVFYRFGGAAPNRVIKPRKQTLNWMGKTEEQFWPNEK